MVKRKTFAYSDENVAPYRANPHGSFFLLAEDHGIGLTQLIFSVKL
jgi:hypothetical protein